MMNIVIMIYDYEGVPIYTVLTCIALTWDVNFKTLTLNFSLQVEDLRSYQNPRRSLDLACKLWLRLRVWSRV